MSASLTVALAMILFGAAMIYAGWTGRSLKSLLIGDNTQAKKAAA